MSSQSETPPTESIDQEKVNAQYIEKADKAEGPQQTIWDVLPKDQPAWWRQKHLLLLNLGMVIPYLSSTTNGYDGSMLNGLQSMVQWQNSFHSPAGTRLGSLANGTIFGQVIAFPIAPYLCDKIGRRATIFVGAVILVIGAAIQAAANSYGMFLAARMIIGLGSLIAVEPSPLLVTELAYPTHRPILTAYYNTLWYLGAILAAWITYGTYFMGENTSWAWRIPSLLQGALPLVQVVCVFLLPESPRWLILKGRHEAARRVLVKYHAGGDENSPLVDFEMREITEQIEFDQRNSGTSYMEFLKTPGNRHRLFLTLMVPTMMQLSGNGLVSYYLHLVLNSIGMTSSVQQLRINGGLMIFNWGTALASASLVEIAGRRRLFLFSMTGMLTSYVIWTILSAINQERNFSDPSLGAGVVTMIFMYYLSYNAGLNGMPWLYQVEILPTHLRAKGANLNQIMTTCVLIYNGYANPVAMEAIGWKYYIVYCCVIFVELWIIYFLFPETRGRTLEEVAEIFDNDQTFLERTRNSKKHVRKGLRAGNA